MASVGFNDVTSHEVTNFWFGDHDLSSSSFPEEAVIKRWFSTNADFDEECRRFEPLLKSLPTSSPELNALATTPGRALSLLLLLDQFPRNLFRKDSAPVYNIYDPLAQNLALYSIDDARRFHEGVNAEWKNSALALMWFILPLIHSEDLLLHKTGQNLVQSKIEEASAEARPLFSRQLAQCQQHSAVVERFGRYPYRNRDLGRESTEEEKQWLEGGSVAWARN